MKNCILLFCIFLTCASSSLKAASDTFIDYQNYNHGYCPECNCYPCRCGEFNTEGTCPTCPPGSAPSPNPVPGNPPTCSTCKKPDPCDPAPVCGTNCGISLCVIGVVVAGVAAAAAIIVSSNNGSAPSH